MKNRLGNSVSVTLFGESHGPYIGAVVDGLAPGIDIDEAYIAHQLTLRRPHGSISTPRKERDAFEIVSGMLGGKTTGTPLTILIPNGDTKSKDYSKTRDVARPGHADLTAQLKYHGYQDFRGGGHFS
jgi:chorismate synthase